MAKKSTKKAAPKAKKIQATANQNSKRSLYLLVVSVVVSIITVPVIAAVLIQNFITTTVNVENPVFTIAQGADADYDGDGDDNTGFLQVRVGQAVSNADSTLGTPGTNDTDLATQVEVEFTCFVGTRTYYTDVLQLINTSPTDSVDITAQLTADFAGNPAVEDTFADTNTDGGDADIWLFTSSVDSSTAVTSFPNPGLYGTGSLTDWYDNDGTDGGIEAIQLEIVNSTLQTVAGNTSQGPITIPANEQRQFGIVVDCGSNMADETGANTGIFRLTYNSTVN